MVRFPHFSTYRHFIRRCLLPPPKTHVLRHCAAVSAPTLMTRCVFSTSSRRTLSNRPEGHVVSLSPPRASAGGSPYVPPRELFPSFSRFFLLLMNPKAPNLFLPSVRLLLPYNLACLRWRNQLPFNLLRGPIVFLLEAFSLLRSAFLVALGQSAFSFPARTRACGGIRPLSFGPRPPSIGFPTR